MEKQIKTNIKRITTLLLFVFLFPTLIFSQSKTDSKNEDDLNIITSFRINFDAFPEQKEIFDLFKNYLNTDPSTNNNDNPYWNSEEREKYSTFDLSAPSIYQSSDFLNSLEDLKKNVDIYILSIDKIKDNLYSINAQYQFKGGLKNSSSIWCIQHLNAIKENGKWKLQNNIVHYTKNWSKTQTEFVTYHYPNGYSFDQNIAKKANNFIENIVADYNLTKPQNIDYYLAESTNQMGKLLGFDFFGAGVTTGITSVQNGYIMSSKNPFHAHEFVHFAFKDKEIKRNFLIEEGCADYLGARIYDKQDYNKNMMKLANDIKNDNTYSIKNLILRNENVTWNNYNWQYPFGALICKMVYEKKGKKGLKKLMFSNTENPDDLQRVLIEIMNFKKAEQLYRELKNIAENYR